MERVANVPFRIAGTDAFPAPDTTDPLLDEKRGRERAMLTAYGLCLLAWFVSCLAAAAATAFGGAPGEFFWSVLQVIRVAALGTGALAALSGVWMHAAYVGFRRRSAPR